MVAVGLVEIKGTFADFEGNPGCVKTGRVSNLPLVGFWRFCGAIVSSEVGGGVGHLLGAESSFVIMAFFSFNLQHCLDTQLAPAGRPKNFIGAMHFIE